MTGDFLGGMPAALRPPVDVTCLADPRVWWTIFAVALFAMAAVVLLVLALGPRGLATEKARARPAQDLAPAARRRVSGRMSVHTSLT